jgi:hypothetical protein
MVSRVSHAAPPAGQPPGGVVAAVLAGCGVLGFVLGSLMGAASGADEDAADTAGEAPTVGAEGAWDGAVAPVPVTVVEASCQSDASRDAAGERVTYEPEFAVDGDPQSAWRCPGDGAGETLVLDLGGIVPVAELGLVPGYAKTDAADGTDRYAENRRITAVRWRFDDGTTVDQQLEPDPALRDLQTLRISLTATRRIALEIVGSSDAARNTIAVSDLRVSAAA